MKPISRSLCPHSARLDEEFTTKRPVKLVAVLLALFSERGKDELTKKGRKEGKLEDFGWKQRAFNRGRYGVFSRK